MRPLALLLGAALLLPIALAAPGSGTDAAGDQQWAQTSPEGPDVGAILGCRDPGMDILGYDIAVQGDRLIGSLRLSDGDGVPTCLVAPMRRLDGFSLIRMEASRGGSAFGSAVVAYDIKEVCIYTIVSGTSGATARFPLGPCDHFGDEITFDFPANGTLGGVPFDFRGATLHAFAVTSEIVGAIPVAGRGLPFEGRITDFAAE